MQGSTYDDAVPDLNVSNDKAERVESDEVLAMLDLTSIGIHSVVRKNDDPATDMVVLVDKSTIALEDVNRLVPCFTPGTMIATPRGAVPVETLEVGDRVVTRDNGFQTIEWVGKKRLDHLLLKTLKALRPIRITAGALAENVPDRDMQVSPAHRMLIVSNVAQLYFGQSEVLVAAKDMCDIPGVDVAETPYVTYVHFLCENHELVLADGAWSESFQPNDFSLKGMDEDQREELFALFPELATPKGIKDYRAARPSLSRQEAALIFKKK